MTYPGRHNIYEATIRRMVQEALDLREEAFRQEHGNDTDQQLLEYLRENALQLHHTPWPGEIVGGTCIEERFGTWNRALTQANLPPPRQSNQPKNFARFREETERQKERYRQRKAEKKALAQKRLAQQTARKKDSQRKG